MAAGSTEFVDASEFVRLREEYEEQLDTFMIKYLRRSWPSWIVTIIGVFQLLLALTMLGIDLPIILMFAPRWQVFAGCWGAILAFIGCVSTLISARETTLLKVKWAAALNIVAGIAIALMVAFDILYLVNPKICLLPSGCNYLSYTYGAVKSYYSGEVAMGILFFITVFAFLFICIKFGAGGLNIFENIQKGQAEPLYKSGTPSNGFRSTPVVPVTGPGAVMNPRPPGPTAMPSQQPPPAQVPRMMVRGPVPPGPMPGYPGAVPPSGHMPGYPGAVPPPGHMPGYPGPMPRPMMMHPPGSRMPTQPGYGPPQPGYGRPQPGYGPPQPGYGPPQPGVPS